MARLPDRQPGHSPFLAFAWAFVWAFVLALGLAACAAAPDPEAPAQAAARETPVQDQPMVQTAVIPTPRPKSVAPAASVTALPPVPPEPATPALSPWTPPVPGPKHLVGLKGGQVSLLLGPPDFRRKDNPAEIWQYRDTTCVLDLFLYGSPSDDTFRVAHAEVRDLGPKAVSTADCFRRLFKDRPQTSPRLRAEGAR